MRGPRVLFLDIETAPIEALVWGLFDQNVGLEAITADRSILSFAASWLNDDHVFQFDTGGRGVAKVRDDRKLLGEVWPLLNEADIVVVHNGKRFDVPIIKARMVMAGLKPFSPFRVVDTLQAAKRFGFTSNKLAHLTKALAPDLQKLTHGEFPGMKLWIECLKDNPAAWRVMAEYNIRDVVGLKPVYLKLRPWLESHPNVAVYCDDEIPRCPVCGSDRVKRNGSDCTQAGVYPRFKCNACGKFSRGKLSLNSTSKRRSLLT